METSTTSSYHPSNSSTTTASAKNESVNQTIELLAKQILEYSGVLPDLPKEWFDTVAQAGTGTGTGTGTGAGTGTGTGDDPNSNPVSSDNGGYDTGKVGASTEVLRRPYLTSLEKILGIEGGSSVSTTSNHPSTKLTLKEKSMTKNESKHQQQNNLLTCTDFKANPFHHSTNKNDHHHQHKIGTIIPDSSKPQIWSPPILDNNEDQTDQCNNKKGDDYHPIYNHNNIHEFIIPSLEDYTPFNHEFYTSIGRLVSFVYYSQTTSSNYNQKLQSKISGGDTSSGNTNQNVTDARYIVNDEEHVLKSSRIIEQYTLDHDIDPVRITKILSSLMHIDLGIENDCHENDERQSTNNASFELPRKRKQNENNQNNHTSSKRGFMDFFLCHVEQNTRFDIDVTNNKDVQRQLTMSSSSSLFSSLPSKPSIPFIQAIFKHYSTLPQLESHVHTVIRKHKSIMQQSQSTKFKKENGINMELRIEHMKKTQLLEERLEKELQLHMSSMESIIGAIYLKSDVELRMKIRLRIGHILQSFVMQSSTWGVKGGGIGSSMGIENTSAAGIDSMLKVLYRILEGVQIMQKQQDHGNQVPKAIIVEGSYKDLLMDILLPLHKPSGMVLWRDQQPILGLYHVSLVKCIGVIASLDRSFIGVVIRYLIHPDIWPLEGGVGKGSAANTPKVILLLHEIDTLIGLLKVPTTSSNEQHLSASSSSQHDTMSETIIPLVTRLATSIQSDNSRTSERALEFFKNETFKSILKLHLSKVMTILLRGLCRVESGMDIPWNPTVRKMTQLVLRELESFDKNIFLESCSVLSKRKSTDRDRRMSQQQNAEQSQSPMNSIQIKSHDQSPSAEGLSLKLSMGKWKPPKKGPKASSTTPTVPKQTMMSNIRKGTAPPPLTVTGVAPWSVKSFAQTKSNNVQPPLTVTGVAPWSVKKVPRASPNHSTSKVPVRSTDRTSLLSKQGDSSGNTNADEKQHTNPSSVVESNNAAELWIQSYLQKLKPSHTDGNENDNADGVSEWCKTQMAESPLLLPTLKFHDLVFGQVLGTGSFSTVKYARQILKGKTRSYWPEFAVKVISTEKIEELGYEHSVNREIAILQTLSHPGIARLVSSFRFREGAYLILEYGSGGDLHSLLKQNGSLDENSTRFVVGELVAALHSIHEMGMVFVDLKPENILVTESRHVKITDFGGCRPLTDEAKLLVKRTGRNLLKHLRDGDWRDSVNPMSSPTEIKESSEVGDDNRIEGTTAYLPPEVILGSYPTITTDSWALGCVFYQCLAGKPPLLDNSESRTKQKIISFDANLSHTEEETDNIFSAQQGNGASTFSSNAKDLIMKLLSRNPTDRPNMVSISDHDFFNGMNVFNLYKRTLSALVAGQIKPQPNAAWTRRQFSSIWAPQPQAYHLSSFSQDRSKNNIAASDGPIIEGAEKKGPFLLKQNSRRPLLVGIAEKMH